MLFNLAGIAALAVASATARPDVYTYYPYTGPEVPVGDWVDNTVNGNGKGFPRLVVPPAVAPNSSHPTNNINVVTLAYIPNGMNIHFSTPFGIGASPHVKYGSSASDLSKTATGATTTFGRTPSCSAYDSVTQCSEYFHNVQIQNLTGDTVYYYQIPGGNGTTSSPVMQFKTAIEAGVDNGEFSLLVVNDMGFTNAGGTHKQMTSHAKDKDTLFVWHGGDISYADDWYSGILPCDLTGPDAWPVCYNGTSTSLPGGNVPAEYDVPLSAGEVPDQGGPQGGDYSVIYESNWDLWQNWMTSVTEKIPYMTTAGNHEAACAEFDGNNGTLSAYLNKNQPNSTDPTGELTYFSCPPSQRNFTGYQYRFRMPGQESGGKGNFWYSFDVGLAHFVSFASETDYYQSPSTPFVADLVGDETLPKYNETYITDAGPFGYINGSYKDNQNYEQYQWLKQDLASVNRTKTPWVFAMSHRPMYSSQVAKYQTHIRTAFEQLFIEHNVDAYFAGHIHWYERMLPLNNGTIIEDNVINNHTYLTNDKGLIHVTNGQAGNIESHSELDGDPRLNITAFLDATYYGNSKLTIFNSTMARWQFIHGLDGEIGDELYIVRSQ